MSFPPSCYAYHTQYFLAGNERKKDARAMKIFLCLTVGSRTYVRGLSPQTWFYSVWALLQFTDPLAEPIIIVVIFNHLVSPHHRATTDKEGMITLLLPSQALQANWKIHQRYHRYYV